MLRRLLPLAAVVAALVCASAASAYPHARGAAVPHNPANAHRLLGTPIEASVYDPATHCASRTHPGMLDLERWLAHHVRGVFHSAADRRAAQHLIDLLLAPDRDGNPQALACRMGVEEIIWNCGYWGAGMSDFEPYSVCFTRSGKRKRGVDDTTAHRDHVHLGMTKAGAAARTSFWR